MKVADKVAIVTGGGNGIGAALAAKLAHQDARVVVADINSQAADAVASGSTPTGPARPSLPAAMSPTPSTSSS